MLPQEEFVVRELDTVRVKGKKEPAIIYDLLGYGAYFQQMHALVDCFHQGLTAYKAQRWDEGLNVFEQILEEYPDDGPSKVYIDRCTRYRWEPPPEDWDGVYEMRTK